MSYTVTGKITEIKDEIQITDNFSKREVWLLIEDGKYQQTVCLEFSNQNCSRLDNHSIGDMVTITFKLRGRVWQDKCFNTLSAFSILHTGKNQVAPATKEKKSVPVKRKTLTPPENNEWMEPSGKSEAFSKHTDIEAVDDLPF